MEPKDISYFETPEDFRVWLAEHHTSAEELWVGYWKKATGYQSVTWEETVDEALCHGWIDGIRKTVDDEAYTIRFTPRRVTSVWSRRNIDRYAFLSKAGRVLPAGQAAWSKRRKDRSGVYSFEQDQELTLSTEYLKRLQAHDEARRFWDASPPGYRKRASHWVMSAKREETRERRLDALVRDSAASLRVKPLRRS